MDGRGRHERSRTLTIGHEIPAALTGGEWEQAIEAIERAQAISSERRTAADAEGWYVVRLGVACLGLGDTDRAAGLARHPVTLLRGREQPAGEIAANVVLARALLAILDLGARDEIEAALTRAQDLVDNTGAHDHEPAIHVELAELAHQNRDETERERELREAHRLFAQIGATGHAERLASQLETIAD